MKTFNRIGIAAMIIVPLAVLALIIISAFAFNALVGWLTVAAIVLANALTFRTLYVNREREDKIFRNEKAKK